MATPLSILAWEIPWTEEPGGLRPRESQRVGWNRACTHIKAWISLDSLCSPPVWIWEWWGVFWKQEWKRKTHKTNISHLGELWGIFGFIAALSSSRSGLSELCRSLTEILKRTDQCLQFKTMAHVSWCFFFLFEILPISRPCIHTLSLFWNFCLMELHSITYFSPSHSCESWRQIAQCPLCVPFSFFPLMWIIFCQEPWGSKSKLP